MHSNTEMKYRNTNRPVPVKIYRCNTKMIYQNTNRPVPVIYRYRHRGGGKETVYNSSKFVLGLRPICCKKSLLSLCKRITYVACSCLPSFTFVTLSLHCKYPIRFAIKGAKPIFWTFENLPACRHNVSTYCTYDTIIIRSEPFFS